MRYFTVLKEDSDILLNGDRCITNLQELYGVLLLKDTTEIVLCKEFTDKYFTTSGLLLFIQSVQSINSVCRIVTEEVEAELTADIVEEIKSLRTREDFLHALMFKEHDILNAIQDLCKFYRDTVQENVAANNKVATLHLLNSQIIHRLERREEDYQNLMVVKNDFEAKLKTLIARINYNHNKDIDANRLLQVTGHRYDKVLYIREISRVHFTDTLIYYIQEILKITYGVPCRLVVIEAENAYNRCKLYPRCKPHFDLTKQDVFQSDIVMAGFQYRLFEDIIHNPSHMNYLIVLDRGGYNNSHLYGTKIEQIFTTSDLSDLAILGIEVPNEQILSYSSTTLNIPYVSNFENMSIEERMRVYSSLDVVQKIIEMVERRG